MLDFVFLVIMFVWKCFDLSVPVIVIVSVDLSSEFEGYGWTIYLESLRRLEFWLVSCWCGCS